MNKLIYKILIPCLLLLVSACNQQEKVKTPFLYVIFTDSTYPDSELIALDKNGLITDRKQIEGQGIYQIAKNNRGDLYLPITFQNKIAIIDHTSDKILLNESERTPMFMKIQDELQLTLFNIGFDKNTLEVVEKGQRTIIDLDSTALVCTFDDQYIYVRGDASFNNSDAHFLYVIDRKEKKIINKVKLEEIGQTVAMDIIDGKLWIGSFVSEQTPKEHLLVIDPKTWKKTYIKLNNGVNEGGIFQTVKFFADEKFIYVVDAGNLVTVLDRKTWNISKIVSLSQDIKEAATYEGKAYILSQENNGTDAMIGVYSLPNWNLETTWSIRSPRETLPQNLLINPDH